MTWHSLYGVNSEPKAENQSTIKIIGKLQIYN